MKRIPSLLRVMVPVLLVYLAGCGSDQDGHVSPFSNPVPTTLVQNYLPVPRPGGGFDLVVGPGEPHRVLDLPQIDEPPEGARFWSLAYWHVSTDQHVADEECPARLAFYDAESVLDGMLTDGFGPQEDISPHLWSSAILTANGMMESYDRSFDMALCLGDFADNASLVEMEWFAEAADGPPSGHIRPDTGDLRIVNGRNLGARNLGSQENFNPYTRPGYPNSNADFPAQRLQTPQGDPVPWYGAVGNHDAFNMGNFPVDEPGMPMNNFIFDGQVYVGGHSPFGYLCGLPTLIINTLDGDPIPPEEFYNLIGGPAIGSLLYDPVTLEALLPLVTDGEEAIRAEIDPHFSFDQVVPEPYDPLTSKFGVQVKDDASRSFAGSQGLIERLRTKGHGFWPNDDECNRVFPGGVDPNQGYYTLEAVTAGGLALPVRLIILNGNELSVFSMGGISSTQYQWLECQLERARRDRRLVVVLSHHQEYSFLFIERGPCQPPCIGTTECAKVLKALFLEYPNMILHLVGHGHTNEIMRHTNPDEPGHGYWEIQTASTSWWPQQTRILEIVIYENGTGEIWNTIVDHFPLSPDADTNRLTELARYLALDDPQLPLDRDGNPSGGGTPDDRNRVLRFEVLPEIMDQILEIPPSKAITSRDVFPCGAIQ